MQQENHSGLRQRRDRRGIYRLLSWLAVIAWMLLIFSFSQAAAPVSAATSLSVTERLLRFFGQTPSQQTLEFYESLVRQAAHFGLFFVLGCLVKLALTQSQAVHPLWQAILLSCGYALSDEIHQLFVAGRAFQISDLLLDWSGCVLGIYLTLFFLWLFKKE